ncbi:chaperonin 10-like protein [Roridomyces roridus]|uniref:Chaperonin 10-like protein n=1 Tax=Roridomyces roridus TaxID=1738132 RepID=A0AAD7BCJ7_9AGAR|nr:chaperonin 10-like protein [Roridomyces roridus]
MSSAKTNLALIVNDKPFSRTIQDRGVPTPGAEELLVRIEAAGLNPVDARLGNYHRVIAMWPEFPTVLGAEAAGVVVALGSEVKGFQVGDRVAFGTAGQKADVSSYQQYSLAHSSIVAKLPSTISLEEGASIPVGLFTSYHALYAQPPDGAGLVSPLSPGGRGKYAGQAIVILGGAGATGHYGLQLARLSGFSTIITTASLKHSDWLKSLGATHVLDRTLPDAALVDAISGLAPGLSIVFDSISTPATLGLGLAVLKASKTKGKKTLLQIILIPIAGAESAGIDVYMGWAASAWPQYNALSRELYPRVEELLVDGTIKPLKIEVVRGGFNALEEAFKTFDKVSGVKRVVLPQETTL